MALPYPTKVVLPFDIATAQDMNERHANDVALAAGTGLDAGAVTPDQMNLGAQNATELATGTKTSTSYGAALGGTPGTNPQVTVTVPASGIVLVLLHARLQNDTAGSLTLMSFDVTGANTIGATDNNRLVYESSNANDLAIFGGHVWLSGLTPGSTTFELQYRVTAGTGTIGDRRLTVIPIGA